MNFARDTTISMTEGTFKMYPASISVSLGDSSACAKVGTAATT